MAVWLPSVLCFSQRLTQPMIKAPTWEFDSQLNHQHGCSPTRPTTCICDLPMCKLLLRGVKRLGDGVVLWSVGGCHAVNFLPLSCGTLTRPIILLVSWLARARQSGVEASLFWENFPDCQRQILVVVQQHPSSLAPCGHFAMDWRQLWWRAHRLSLGLDASVVANSASGLQLARANVRPKSLSH